MKNYWENIFQGSNGYYMDLDNPSRLEIIKYIKKEDSVLDLGCGGGALKSLLPNNRYLGVDYSELGQTDFSYKEFYEQNKTKSQLTDIWNKSQPLQEGVKTGKLKKKVKTILSNK